MGKLACTTVSRVIAAPPAVVFRAFLDPDAVVRWLPPGAMTGVMHAFDPREGGTFSMSLVYPAGAAAGRGKTTGHSDRFQGRFAALVPDACVVWTVDFESADPAFAGTMTIRWTLRPKGNGTSVTVVCADIPPGIRPEDNEAGCRATLEKLDALVGGD